MDDILSNPNWQDKNSRSDTNNKTDDGFTIKLIKSSVYNVNSIRVLKKKYCFLCCQNNLTKSSKNWQMELIKVLNPFHFFDSQISNKLRQTNTIRHEIGLL